jgi:hypothetical protein
MKQYDWQHSKRPKPVNLTPVVHSSIPAVSGLQSDLLIYYGRVKKFRSYIFKANA